jgi:sugar lactone lactonase YvrE
VLRTDGTFVRQWGSQGSGDGQLNAPQGLGIAPDGTVYVADTSNHRIQVFDSEGNLLRKWGSQGSGDGSFRSPNDVAVGPDGLIYVADGSNNRVQVFEPDGTFVRKWGSSGSGDGQFGGSPFRIVVTDEGFVYVAEGAGSQYGRIQKFDLKGNFLGKWALPGVPSHAATYALHIANDGRFYVSNRYLNAVIRPEPPRVSLDEAPGEHTNDRRPSFSFSTQDEGVRFECSLTEEGAGPGFEPSAEGTYEPTEQLEDGSYVFRLRATDPAGDRTTLEREFTVDTVLPRTTITGAPRELSNDPNPVFEFEADEPGASFECKLDDGEWEACSSPAAYEDLADGEHVFRVRAVDLAGNRDPDPPQVVFAIDTVAPSTEITKAPHEFSSDPSPVFEFAADKEGSTFECRLDDGVWEPCESPVAYGDLPDGEHLFSVRATDPLGNVEAEPPVVTFTIDTVAPQTTITSAPRELTNDPDPVFEFAADEEGVSFECRLNEGQWKACSSPWGFESLRDGEHTFSVRATDRAGNTEPEPATHRFAIDTVAPRTEITRAPRGLGNDPNPVFEFEADEPGSTFECRLDSGEWEECASPVSYEGLEDGEHVFRVRATDPLGNVEPEPRSATFTIDTVLPEVSITAGPAGRVADDVAEFAFEADKPGVRFECRLDDGEWEACESPWAYRGLTRGEHVFYLRAIDEAGNVAEASQAFRVVAKVCPVDLPKLRAKVRRAARALKRAKANLRTLEREDARRSKVRGAKRRLAKTERRLRRAKAELRRARNARCPKPAG